MLQYSTFRTKVELRNQHFGNKSKAIRENTRYNYKVFCLCFRRMILIQNQSVQSMNQSQMSEKNVSNRFQKSNHKLIKKKKKERKENIQ